MKKTTALFSWDNFVVKELEKKHDIKAVAKRDGLSDEPATNSTGSVLEGEISQECDTYISKHQDKLRTYLKDVEENQNELSSHLKQNHFEPIVNNLDSSFHALANEKQIILSDLKNNYTTYKDEQSQFQKYHQLGREPNFATTRKTIKAVAAYPCRPGHLSLRVAGFYHGDEFRCPCDKGSASADEGRM